MSAHPNWVCGCKGTKKIAYALGICYFFGVECKSKAICQTTGKSKTDDGMEWNTQLQVWTIEEYMLKAKLQRLLSS